MANFQSIARPYALAAFSFAQEQNQLPAWKSFLEAGAQVARDKRVIALLNNPEVYAPRAAAFFTEVLQSLLDEHKKNFIQVLALNGRLCALPDIFETFSAYYAALEKVSKVRVITAIEADKAYQEKLSQVLTKKLDREVAVQYEIDPSLIGGAIIHIGDRVIDGSVRGKLNRMLQNLTG
jgi:F-type H+-transporting ATPase subunit delta